MATSTSIIKTQTSQLTANLTPITAGKTASVTAITLPMRLGKAQTVRVRMTVDTTDAELEIIFYDQVFETEGLFGERKQGSPQQGKEIF
jgi:hypothetical protein